MSTIFMDSKNSKTSDLYRLVLSLTYKTDLRGDSKRIALPGLSICYLLKNIKKLNRNKKYIYQEQHSMENVNYLMDLILYQILKTILSISLRNMKC